MVGLLFPLETSKARLLSRVGEAEGSVALVALTLRSSDTFGLCLLALVVCEKVGTGPSCFDGE